MDGAQFTFRTDAFADEAERVAENVNGMAGHALATWLSDALRARGLDASGVCAEDHGWDFSLAHGGAKYICACLVNVDEGGPTDASVVVGKTRSFMDKLKGRNKYSADDAVVAAISEALRGDPRVRELVQE